MWHFRKTREREYLSGIPARDLTDAEVGDMTAEQRELLELSPLYVHRDDPPENATAAADNSADGSAAGPTKRGAK